MATAVLISGIIVVLTTQATLANLYAQRVTVYKWLNCEGPGVEYDQNIPDLVKGGWDNVARSVKVTGIWIFYEKPIYNTLENGLMQQVFGDYEYCIQLFKLGSHLSSFRFAGQRSDYRNNTLTLYREENFQGREELIIGDIADVNMKLHKSMIITGTSSWTIYDYPSYKGGGRCVDAETVTMFDPVFIFNIEDDLVLPFDSIRSVRLGCHGVAR